MPNRLLIKQKKNNTQKIIVYDELSWESSTIFFLCFHPSCQRNYLSNLKEIESSLIEKHYIIKPYQQWIPPIFLDYSII